MDEILFVRCNSFRLFCGLIHEESSWRIVPYFVGRFPGGSGGGEGMCEAVLCSLFFLFTLEKGDLNLSILQVECL